MSEMTARIRPDDAPRPSKAFRIDRGSARGSDLAPGRGSLLRLFGVWGGTADARRSKARGGRPSPAPAPERRTEDRHRVECLAWVGWKSWRRFDLKDALMIDLSRGGARIFLDAAPPTGRPVWVFIETPGRNTVVKARVLEVQTTSGGQCVARVGFDTPCPYAFFEAAVSGLAPVDPKKRLAPAPRVMARPPAALRTAAAG